MKKTIVILITALAMLLVSCNSASNTATPLPTVSETATAAPTPVPTLTPSPTPAEPTPSPTPAPYVKLTDSNSSLSVRQGPGTNTEKLGSLKDGDPVTIVEQGDVWHKILYNGQEAYVFAAYVANVPVKYAYVPALTATVDGKTYVSDMVDVRYICPDIKIWLTWASQDNVLNKKFYPAGACLLQRETAEKLKAANDLFMKDGYRIRLYDGYRPYSVSVELYKIVRNGSFVQNPANGPSTHNRGAAVDITLESLKDGEQIPMFSQMHTFDVSSRRDLPDMTKLVEGSDEYNAALKKYPGILEVPKRSSTATRNVAYLTKIMKKCGFTTINSEWWHYNDSNKNKFMVLDYDLSKDVQWIPAEEYEAFLAAKDAEGPLTTLPAYVISPKPGTESPVNDQG